MARPTRTAKTSKPRRGAQRKVAECVFKKGFVTETVDPLVDELWKASIGGKTPFGDLRNMWRRHHCRKINPYGDSENCPYDPVDCARAFYAAVRDVTRANDARRLLAPVGYFIAAARSRAAARADEAVGRRAQAAMMRRTHVLPQPPTTSQPPRSSRLGEAAPEGSRPRSPGGSAGAGGAGAPPAASDRSDARLPGVGHGPISVGDLFRSLELGSRQGRPDDGEEGAGR